MGRGELRGGEKKGMGLGADGKRLLYLGTEMGVGTEWGWDREGGGVVGGLGGSQPPLTPFPPRPTAVGCAPPPARWPAPACPP